MTNTTKGNTVNECDGCGTWDDEENMHHYPVEQLRMCLSCANWPY